jgi:hypothetical protein
MFAAKVSGKVWVRMANAICNYMREHHGRDGCSDEQFPTREEIITLIEPEKFGKKPGVGKATRAAFGDFVDFLRLEKIKIEDIQKARDAGDFDKWASQMAMKQCQRFRLSNEVYFVISGLMRMARDFEEKPVEEKSVGETLGGCKHTAHPYACGLAYCHNNHRNKLEVDDLVVSDDDQVPAKGTKTG